ncbi:hypothetical protein E7Z59_08885 [Robertkochia marina]|uniref:Uncharacterized protein n=1 Tax=Robertkochia marina TaxID=1227945 RepID=A0A4V6RRT6_9FLAO|nr:hypothetical protein E7Z59_08885 [Robertkochia marina]TRZ40938.1 hypothetical protein D3A96_14570 [Robertkochia marina]
MDENGCSDSQNTADTDGDGVADDDDDCPDTPEGAEVNENGCATSQLDSDGDGVNDDADQCPDTPQGAEVDENGCATSQLDSDEDGVNDDADQCPDTPEGEEVDEQGCSDSQKDSDGDGVNDAEDECPETPEGQETDENGCADSQKDDDRDGVSNADDQCPDTPEGSEVNEEGCVAEARTYVPDDGFEENLIRQGYDDVMDDYVLTANIENITELGIGGFFKNLTGLQDFKSLKTLTLFDSSIENFDVLPEVNLITLDLEGTDGRNFIIDAHPTLERFYISSNSIGPKEIINNPQLKVIGYFYSDGGTILVKNNPMLEGFYASECGFGTLSIKNNSNLNEVLLGDYQDEYFLVNNLIIEDNPVLNEIEITGGCDNFILTNTQNLKSLTISGDTSYETTPKIPAIDLSDLPLLETLVLKRIVFTELDVSFNTNLINFELIDHDITCVKVNQQQLDNIPSTWVTDPEVTYSLNCN